VRTRYNELLQELNTEKMSEGMKMLKINDFFNNNILYKRDGKDHWQSLQETLTREEGDCEDFAIAKFSVSILTGIPSADLSLVYCYEAGIPHMVLRCKDIIYNNTRLDALNCRISELVPVYQLTLNAVYTVDKYWNTKRVGEAGKIQKWERIIEEVKNGII